MLNYNILVGGAAGQGMDTLSYLLEKIIKKKGYHIFSNKDYMSRVRGGHNFIQTRFGLNPLYSHEPKLDIIIALDKNTVDIHTKRLVQSGIILCDEGIEVEDPRVLHIPMKKIAKEIGNPKVVNTVALGACIKLLGLSMDQVEKAFEERFNETIKNLNIDAFKKGYEQVEKRFEVPEAGEDENIFINTNQAIALGALAGGLSYYSAYPMTPSTSVMSYLADKQEDAKIIVEQAEDEIAAINMAIGASYTGVRAMTGSSGGGFSLMVESLGLAAVQETPLVVIDIQRPSPATGLPTRTEQSDLSFVLTASHGEIPRMVIAVRNPEDAFYQTARALNLADKYQLLVIILGDQFIGDGTQTMPPFDFDKITIDRHLSDGKELEEEYKRYKLTENGLSPRLIPGQVPGQVVISGSEEHDEYGRITEDAELRVKMMQKRMKKMDLLADEIQEPEYFGVEDPDHLLLSWGSIHGPIKEAVELLKEDGISIGALVFGDIYPLPTKLLKKYSEKAKNIINVEQNYTGQLAKLITQETCIQCNKSVLKYDGRQMDYKYIYDQVKGEVL